LSAGRFRYEPGSCGGPAAAGYMPSILCYECSWPDAGLEDDPEAPVAIAHKHLETAFMQPGGGEEFATSLKDAGYVRASDFRMAVDDGF
jgi:hypothetical protein